MQTFAVWSFLSKEPSMMDHEKKESGQVLILIVFGLIGLIGMTALVVDGGLAYSDRRSAQNAADSAAWAGALAYGRGQDIDSAALSVAQTNGYEQAGAQSDVIVSVDNTPSGECPGSASGVDITIEITSILNTYFGPVVGIDQVTNRVSAITRSCGSFTAPMFDGNAIVALSPSGTGFDAHGTPDWLIQGGGIFTNSSSSSSAICGGSAGVTAPSVTSVGGTSFTCATVDIDESSTNQADAQVTWADVESLMPPTPDCDGTATYSDGRWYPQDGADGSNVVWDDHDDMLFASGLYCVTNSPGPVHGQIYGNGVTFYITSSNFNMTFNGGGNLTATAPSGGDYAGVLLYLAPQVSGGVLQNTQALDLRGNGSGSYTGTIIAPSADVTMFGNSSNAGFNSQIIAYQVDSGGNADIYIQYDAADNYQPARPVTLYLLK
jgi:hypothetical protein